MDLIITSQNPSGFVSGLADLYGRKKLMDVNQDPSCYSAGLILALAESIAGGEFGRSKTILFVSAGPGIVVDLALYSSGEQ